MGRLPRGARGPEAVGLIESDLHELPRLAAARGDSLAAMNFRVVTLASIGLVGSLLGMSCGGKGPQIAAGGNGPSTTASGGSNPSAPASTGGGNSVSTSSTISTSPKAAPIPLDSLCPLFTNDLCVYLMQCAHAAYRDMDHCKAEVDCYGLPVLTAAAAAGKVLYDPSAVGTCSAKFLNDPCNFFGSAPWSTDIFSVLAQCPGAIAAKVPVGDACEAATGECATGYCQKTDRVCPGKCTAYGQVGDSCAGSAPCDATLRCNDQRLCAPYGKVGDLCQTAEDCPPTVTCPVGDASCTPARYFCDPATKACKAAVGEGSPCGYVLGAGLGTIVCADGLWCDQGALTASGTCRMSGGAGAPCSEYGGCAYGAKLHCVGTDSSHPAAMVGVCTPQGSVGASCTFESDCQADLHCAANKACAAPAAVGGACSTRTDCATGLGCAGTVCVKAAYPGDACASDADCVLSLCKNGTCADHAKVGEACATNADCTTGVCAAGVCADKSVCAVP